MANKKLELLNERFGKLTVTEFMGTDKKGTIWKCLCDCGKEKIACGHLLKRGSIKSCGCLGRGGPKRDLTGKKFGKLIVIRPVVYTEGIRKGKNYWFCKCDCGGTIITLGSNLTNGNTKSCGCLRRESFIKIFSRRPVHIINFKTGEVR